MNPIIYNPADLFLTFVSFKELTKEITTIFSGRVDFVSDYKKNENYLDKN